MIKKEYILAVSIAILLVSTILAIADSFILVFWFPLSGALFSFLVVTKTEFRLLIKLGIITGMLILNDFFIRLFHIGAMDPEGLGWFLLLAFLGLLLNLSILITYGIFGYNYNKGKYFLALFCCILIVASYYLYFYSFGTAIIDEPSKNLEQSKNNGVFISEIQFSEKTIIFGKDTVCIKQGWIEKQTELNHLGIIKKTEFTDKVNGIIIFCDSLKEFTTDNSIFVKILNSYSNNDFIVSKKLTFYVDKSAKKQNLIFYKGGEESTNSYKNISIKYDQ